MMFKLSSNKWRLIGLLVGMSLLLTGSVFWKTNARQRAGTQLATVLTPTVTPTPTPDLLKDLNILILGYAGHDHDGGALTDTIILAHIEPRLKKVTLVSIPRDLWVKLETKAGEKKVGYKINAAYAIGNDDRYSDKPNKYTGNDGGSRMLKDVVEEVTDLKVDYFAAVNFDGFLSLINSLGGVEVDVPYSFTDEHYPIKGKENDTCNKSTEAMAAMAATLSGQLLDYEYKCRYETVSFSRGPQRMGAEKALKFVRSRHSATGGGDFGRSQRQRALLAGVKGELAQEQNWTKLLPIARQLKKMISTDIDLIQLAKVIMKYPSLGEFEIKSVALTTQNVLKESKSEDGQYILIPVSGEDNYTAVRAWVENEIKAQAFPAP